MDDPIILLLDGHHTRYSLTVLKRCRELGVHILMGVPNCTHRWQVPDIYNNGVFKISWVFIKRWWLKAKMSDICH